MITVLALKYKNMKKNQTLFVILLLFGVVGALLLLSMYDVRDVDFLAILLFPVLFLAGTILSLISVIKYGSRKAFLIFFYAFPFILFFLMVSVEAVVVPLIVALIGLLVVGVVIKYDVLWSRTKKIIFAVFQSIVAILASGILFLFGILAMKHGSISS